MKTKIIYISGGEAFEMTQIRAAFDEVRSTLGLGNDTVLFGVPVDCDSAIDVTDSVESENNPVAVADVANQQVVDNSTETAAYNDVINQEITPEIIENSHIEIETEITAEAEQPSEKIIPILSVLASKTDEPEQNMTGEDAGAVLIEDAHEEPIVEVEGVAAENVEVVTIDSIDTDEITDDTSNENVEKINIDEIIDEDMPVAPMKKTLEQLLESMTPLREDMHDGASTDATEDASGDDAEFIDEDTDATLAQLASEFVQSEDKIVTPAKTESHGKIGKLKNILPFKKANRDDNGLMGDLFGWAGIAANDDDFSMPGFFTQARKQGS